MMRTKRHYIKLTPGQREELIQQIQAGVDWDTLMANFNVSRSTIYFYKDKIYGKNPAGKVKKKYMRNKKNAKAAAVKMGVWKVEEASGSNQEVDGEVKPKPKDLAAHAAKPSTSSTTEIDSKPLRDLQNPSRFQAPRAAALRANMEIRLDNEFLEDRPRKGKPGPKRGKRRCIAPPVVSAAPIPMSIIPVTSPIPTPVTNLIATHITDPIAAPLAIPITAPVTSGKKEGRRGKAIRGKALRGVSRGRGFRGGRGRGVKIISQEVLLNKTIIHKNQRSLPDMQFEHITTGRTSPLNYMQEAGVSGSSDFSLADNLFETMTIDCSIPEPFIMESPRGTGSAHAHARDPLNSSFSPPSPKSANQLHVQHNFHSRRVLEALVNDEAFVDVTLTAEGRTISAHKLVLSAMSPYFQRVLQANPCRHPVVIMPPSVSFTHLSHIISFMYKGETTVQESELRSLIRTAELLQVSGFRLPNQSPVNDDSSATSSSFSGFSNPQRPSVDDRVIRITEERGTCEEPFHPGSRNVPQHIPVSHTSTLRRAPPVVITHSSQTSTVAPSLPVLNTPVLNTPILNTPVLNTPVLNTPSHSNTFTLATPTTFFLSPSTNPVIIKGRTGAIIPATSIPVISRGSPPSRSFQHRFSSTPVRQQTGTGEGRSGRMLSSPDSPGGGGTVLGVDLDIDIIKEEIPNEEEGGSTVFVADGAWSPPHSPMQSPPQSPRPLHQSPPQSPRPPHQSPPQSPRPPHQSPPQSPRSPHQSPPQLPRSPHQSPPQSPRPPHQSPPQSPRSPHQSPPQLPRSPHQSPPQSPRPPHQSPPQSPRSPHQSPPQSPRSLHQSPPQSPRSLHQSPPQSPQSPHLSPPQSPQSQHQSSLQSTSQSPPQSPLQPQPRSSLLSSPLQTLAHSSQVLCAPSSLPKHLPDLPYSKLQPMYPFTKLSNTNTTQFTGGVSPASGTASSSDTVFSPISSPTGTLTIMSPSCTEITPLPMEVTPSTNTTTTYLPTAITLSTSAAILSVKEMAPTPSEPAPLPMEIGSPTTSTSPLPIEIPPLAVPTTLSPTKFMPPISEDAPLPVEIRPSTTDTTLSPKAITPSPQNTTTTCSPTAITPSSSAAILSVKEMAPTPSESAPLPMEIGSPTTSTSPLPIEIPPLAVPTTLSPTKFMPPIFEDAPLPVEIRPSTTETTLSPKGITRLPQNLIPPSSNTLLNAYPSSAVAASSKPQYCNFSVSSPSVPTTIRPINNLLPSLTSIAAALPKISVSLLPKKSRPPTATTSLLPATTTIPLSISSISKSGNILSTPRAFQSLIRSTSTATAKTQPTGAPSSSTSVPLPAFSSAPLVGLGNKPLLSTTMGNPRASSVPLSPFPMPPLSKALTQPTQTFQSTTQYPLLDLTTTRSCIVDSRKVSVASNKMMLDTEQTSSCTTPVVSLQIAATTTATCFNLNTPPTSSTIITTALSPSPLTTPRVTSAMPTVMSDTQSPPFIVKPTTQLAHNPLLDLITSSQNQIPPLSTSAVMAPTSCATTFHSASRDSIPSAHRFKQYTAVSLKTTTAYTSNPILTSSPTTITPLTSVSIHKSHSSIPVSISSLNLQSGIGSPHSQNSPHMSITESRAAIPPVSNVSSSSSTTIRPELNSLTTTNTTTTTTSAVPHNRLFEVTMGSNNLENQLTVAAPTATLVMDDESTSLSLTPSHYLDSHLSPVMPASDPMDWHSFQHSVTLYDLDSHAPVTSLPPRTPISHDPVFDVSVTSHNVYDFPSTSATDNYSPLYYQPPDAGFESFSTSTYNLDSSPSALPPVTSPVNYDLPDLHPPVSSDLLYSHSLLPPTSTPTLTLSTSPSLQSLVSGQCLYDQPRHTPTPSYSPFYSDITQNLDSPPTTSSVDTLVNHDPITFALKEWRK